MNQQTFSDIEYNNRRKQNRREEFLNTMDRLIPWQEWADLVRPYYPSGKRGRKPKGIETMLRMYMLQHWYGLSAERIEDTIYDSYSMRTFMHIDFLRQQVPASTTLLRFRRLIEAKGISEYILADLQQRLDQAGLILHNGRISDAVLTKDHSRKKAEG